MSKGYDPECGALARYFLTESNRDEDQVVVDDLAQAIQDAVEEWFQTYGPRVQR